MTIIRFNLRTSLWFTIALIVAFAVGYLVWAETNSAWPFVASPLACQLDGKVCPDGSVVGRVPPNCEFASCPDVNDDNTACIQVITKARNPKTGEVRDFPTPCDVPEGWIVVDEEGQINCAPRGSCRNGEVCPAGTECSGIPAFGCYPLGCPYPICLAANTTISTPEGEINVKDLKVGMLVWTQDKSGKKVMAEVLKTSAQAVPKSHKVVNLILEDGRQVFVSPGHPTSDGREVEALKIGDMLDGSKVAVTKLVPYKEGKTYDLLPVGDTGFYWANGILMGSTLTRN